MAIDFTNGTWLQVAEWATQELRKARERNDNPGIASDATAALRGEIAMLKKLLALPEEAARDLQSGSAQAHPIVWGDTSPGY